MLAERIETLLVGNSTGLVNTFREGGLSADEFAAKNTKTGKTLTDLGLKGDITGQQIGSALTAGAGLAAIAVAKFAFDGIEHFSNLTGEVRTLRSVMGGTAEDASRVAGAGRALGLDVDTLKNGFFQLTKRIGDSKDTLAAHGIEIEHNDNGSVNMAKTLGNVSEAFKGMTDPAEKNLFLMQNFGKSGQALIPLLMQGREQLEQFYASTDKHHEVFSEDDLQKGREYKLAMRDLDEAWTGLSTTLGRELIPFITQFAVGLERVVGWIPAVVSGIEQYYDVAGKLTGIGPVIDGVTSAFDALGIGSGDAEKKIGYSIDNIQEKFTGLDATAAAAQFLKINAEAAKTPEHVGKSNQALLDFVQIAREDVGAAQLVIDGLKAQGVNTDVYERALQHIAGTKLADIANTQAQKDATVLLTGSYDDQLKALNKIEDAEFAKIDKGIAAQQAVFAAKDAEDAYTKSLTDGTSTQEDQSKALLAGEEAALRAAAAARAKALADDAGLPPAKAQADATFAQIATLSDLAGTLEPGSPLRVAIEGYIAKLTDPSLNGVHTPTIAPKVDMSEVDAAVARLNALEDKGWNFTVGVSAVYDTPGVLQK